ncbi:MAG: MFS transporter [Actinobacteria bacterium]|nr:MFS transporter [Actinomycetota bacterium]
MGDEADKGLKKRNKNKDEEPSAGVSLELSAFKKVLKNRAFLALWLGQGISGIGDWVIVGVLLDAVYRLGGEQGMGGEMALFWMMFSRFLPAFLFGLVAGAIIDRLERKATLIICELARAVLVIILAFSNSLAMICILVFITECFSLLYGPTRDACIPELVKKKDVMAANSLMSTTTYLTMAIGTMIATVILGLGQLVYRFIPPLKMLVNEGQFLQTFAFMVDALTFIASAMLIFTIRFPKRFEKREKFSGKQVFVDLKEGLVYMWRNQLTRSILGVMIIGFIGGGSLYILGAPFAEQVLNAAGSKFTLILSMLLGGVVAGAALAPLTAKRLPIDKWFGRAVVGFGVTMIVFTFISFYPLSLVVIFMGGVFLGFLIVNAYTLLHHNLDEAVRGRVFAALQTIMRTCLVISMGVFALIANLCNKWIPWKPGDPVYKTLNLGFMEISIYPAMVALIIGGIIVVIGGVVAIHSLKKYFDSMKEAQGGEKAPASA